MVYAVFHPRIRAREEPFGDRRNERSADGTVSAEFDHLIVGGTDVGGKEPPEVKWLAFYSVQFATMRSASGCGESKRIGKTFRPDSKGRPAFPAFLGIQRLFKAVIAPPTPRGN